MVLRCISTLNNNNNDTHFELWGIDGQVDGLSVVKMRTTQLIRHWGDDGVNAIDVIGNVI